MALPPGSVLCSASCEINLYNARPPQLGGLFFVALNSFFPDAPFHLVYRLLKNLLRASMAQTVGPWPSSILPLNLSDPFRFLVVAPFEP